MGLDSQMECFSDLLSHINVSKPLGFWEAQRIPENASKLYSVLRIKDRYANQ